MESIASSVDHIKWHSTTSSP